MSALKRRIFLFALALLVPVAVHAQAVTGASISGTVKDASGAVLPAVTVESASPALIEKSRGAPDAFSGQDKIENLLPAPSTPPLPPCSFTTHRHQQPA